jgi:hypothetical protein
VSNVPDDWERYWRTCYHCGTRFHESEGGCDCPAVKSLWHGPDPDDELEKRRELRERD